jgi:hypothetical protein
MPAVARILSRYDRQKVEAFIAVAIDLLDVLDGDENAEPATWADCHIARESETGLPDDIEPNGDEQDVSWIDHDGQLFAGRHEDDEEDDPSGQCSEDEISCAGGSLPDGLPGCPWGDGGI